MPVKGYGPKFFNKILTGSGKGTGIISADKDPWNVLVPTKLTADDMWLRYKKFQNGNTTVWGIPVGLLNDLNWICCKRCFGVNDLTKIGTCDNNDVYMRVEPFTLHLSRTEDRDSSKYSLSVCYEITLWLHDPSDAGEADVFVNFKTSYISLCRSSVDEIVRFVKRSAPSNSVKVDSNAIESFIENYSLYYGLCELSERWQSNIDRFVNDSIVNTWHRTFCKNNKEVTYRALQAIGGMLTRLGNYNVPLEIYERVYACLKSTITNSDYLADLCRGNLNLVLLNTLNDLKKIKPGLNRVVPCNGGVTVSGKLSNEQRKAVMSSEPLILTQAGAGTGKSTVVLSRIEYMVDCGVDPSDIVVLSFTNAAADNILQKNPDVQSLTIANMVHKIYSFNYPDHMLSNLDTLINCLSMHKDDDCCRQFVSLLQSNLNSKWGAFSDLALFVESNFDRVIELLNMVGQTTLELEIIICHLKIDTICEPDEFKSKFVIIDEVQDNSVFEFIYLLKYVAKHNANLFLVGDCSQTLYEFRSANPRALNTLEGSGVFATYQLQTNYRSNQEILDFANVTLSQIDANKFANIELHADSFAPVSEQSFRDRVRFEYFGYSRITDFNNDLDNIVRDKCFPYVDDKLARGEQVLFLAYQRMYVYMMRKVVSKEYTDANIVTLVPDRGKNLTALSDFVRRRWNGIMTVSTDSLVDYIVDVAHKVLSDSGKTRVQADESRMIVAWRDKNVATVMSWCDLLKSGGMSLPEFYDKVKANLLMFEVNTNALRQNLLSKRNERVKSEQSASDANILFSTIHSVKGLEFDNVVLLYHASNDMSEDDKRMYYVALTRAKNSELVIAYNNSLVEPSIVRDYENICNRLSAKARGV